MTVDDRALVRRANAGDRPAISIVIEPFACKGRAPDEVDVAAQRGRITLGQSSVDALLARFEPPAPAIRWTQAQWWQHGWTQLPSKRNESDPSRRWRLDVQVAGPLAPLRERLQAQGWRVQPQARWEQALNMFDTDAWPAGVPVLPATLEAHTESLLLVRDGPEPDRRLALRLWPAPVQLQPGGEPLWIGTAQTLHFSPAMGLVATWRPRPEADPALEQVREAVTGLPHRIDPHPDSGLPTLRVRTGAATPAADDGATGTAAAATGANPPA